MLNLSCPECQTTFRLDRLPEGTPVQCCNCHYTWTPEAGDQDKTSQHRAFQRSLRELTPRVFVCKGLVAVNVLVFLVMVLRGVPILGPTAQDAIHWGAEFGPLTTGGEWWRLFTCMFVHFGIAHLLFNMWALTVLGSVVERLVGSGGFLLLYVVTGLAASLISLIWQPYVVSAGASGAVFGVLGVQAGLLIRDRTFYPVAVARDLSTSTLAFVVFNVFYGMTVEGIDNAAHLGGLGAGVLAGMVLGDAHLLSAAAKRTLRNGLLAGAASLLLPALAFFATMRPGFAALRASDEFFAVEGRAVDRFQELAGAYDAGELGNEAFAAALEREVLTEWLEATRRLEELDKPGEGRLPIHEKWDVVVEFAGLRRDSWQALLRFLRTGDEEEFQRFQRLNEEAETMLGALND